MFQIAYEEQRLPYWVTCWETNLSLEAAKEFATSKLNSPGYRLGAIYREDDKLSYKELMAL